MLPTHLAGAIRIEVALIVLSSVFLVQPEMLFRGRSDRMRAVVSWAGFLALCVTFCWSVIFGCLLTLHHLVLHT
jgi:hypothetical protein